MFKFKWKREKIRKKRELIWKRGKNEKKKRENRSKEFEWKREKREEK